MIRRNTQQCHDDVIHLAELAGKAQGFAGWRAPDNPFVAYTCQCARLVACPAVVDSNGTVKSASPADSARNQVPVAIKCRQDRKQNSRRQYETQPWHNQSEDEKTQDCHRDVDNRFAVEIANAVFFHQHARAIKASHR